MVAKKNTNKFLVDFIADADLAIAVVSGLIPPPPVPVPPATPAAGTSPATPAAGTSPATPAAGTSSTTPPPTRHLTTGTNLDTAAISAWIYQVELLAKNELGVSHYYHWPIVESLNNLKANATMDNLKHVRQLLFACWQDCDSGRLATEQDKEAAAKLFDAVIVSANLWLGIAAAIVGMFFLKTKVALSWPPSFPLIAVCCAAASFACGCLGFSWIIDALAKSSNLRLSVLGKGTRIILLVQIFLLVAAVFVVCIYWLLGNVMLDSASQEAPTLQNTQLAPDSTSQGKPVK